MSPDNEVSPEGETEVAATRDTIGVGDADAAAELPAPGYDLGDVIGQGGMGEVVSAHDRRIGRDVAIKRMRGGSLSPSSIGRFLREARIQARLDHPAVVPVHELGLDADGHPYFTMKRLAGVTLARRLDERAPIKPMLRAFVDVCLAIQFAHERGVVHRDLKPANIMLGEYGEVYVLDWGIARVLAERSEARSDAGAVDTLDDQTLAGDLLGTPGYMAPEQARGEHVGTAADVYALGAILFEILAGEPLHPRGLEALADTLSSPRQLPSKRASDRDIAPELDTACYDALAEDARARPTARDLADRVQRYLDGDRDVEHRRALAIAQLASARQALASGDPERRAAAMLGAGRALALDPESSEAAQLVTKLIVEPPRVLPAEVASALGVEERRLSSERMRTSTGALLAIMSLAVMLPFVHVRNWMTLGLSFGVLVAATAVVWRGAARGRPHPAISFTAGLALAFGFSRVMGSYVLTPVVIAGSMLAISANAWLNRRAYILLVWLVLATLGPLALEWLGVFRSTWYTIDGGLCSVSAMFEGTHQADQLVDVAGNLLLLGAVAGYGISVNRNAIAARHALFVQAWHLQRLLPGSAGKTLPLA